MNWEAINAISQMVSTVAVISSVLYLAVQVHRSTRIAKLAAQDSAASALREVTRPFAENAELARIWRIGLENLSSLGPEEQARFFHAAFQFLKAFETIHYHFVYGLIDKQTWQGWCGMLEHYIASPGIEHYWKLRHELFSARFQRLVASLQLPAQRRTVGNLLGHEEKSDAA